MEALGLEVKTLEESLYVNSLLGTRVRVDKICQDYELEISVILLTMNLRINDWLARHQVIIDCDSRWVTAYTLDDVCVMFKGDKHDAMPQTVYDSK